jgi:hypothetical protein
MKSNLINYTDVALRKLIVTAALRANPALSLGEDMISPCECFQHGKRVDPYATPEVPAGTVILKLSPSTIDQITERLPKEAPNKHPVAAQTLRVPLNKLETPNGFSEMFDKIMAGSYLHVYECKLQNRELLENYDVGDIVTSAVTNSETFLPAYFNIMLTQEIINANSEVYFRYGLSPK